MKEIKLITSMLNRLDNKTEQFPTVRHVRNGREIYRVEKRLTMYSLYHYDTLTLIYDTEKQDVLYHFGISVSDRDSMNTFLYYFGVSHTEFRFGSNIGFLRVENGMDIKDMGYNKRYVTT